MLGAAVGQVVARDARNDYVFQAQFPRRFSHASWFIRINGPRFSLLHAAKPAAARADVAQDQERGRFPRVALHPVRTLGMVANRLQTQLPDQIRGEMIGVAFRDVALEPTRQGLGIRGRHGSAVAGTTACDVTQLGVARVKVIAVAAETLGQPANQRHV